MINVQQSSLLIKFSNMVRNKYPQLGAGILDISNCMIYPELVPYAEKVLQYYTLHFGLEKLQTEAVDHFARVSFDFLRYQALFNKTNQYQTKSAYELEQKLYSDPEKMHGYYLNGLFLTYALWQNHVKLYKFYIEQFLDSFAEAFELLEVGTGHGLLALSTLEHNSNCKYFGIDLSDASINYTANLLQKASIGQDRFKLRQGDIFRSPEFVQLPDDAYKAGVCCEVLEHVEEPGKILNFFHRILQPSAKLFITTVANIAAEDHIYLFKNVAEIRALINDSGFCVMKELVMPLNDYKTNDYTPLNYAAILQKS